MAKQPRQQPIGFYGKFQPTGVDNSAAQRMQALAGLGETVAGLAKQFGVAQAEEAAPAEAALAVEKAITVNEAGETVFGEVPVRRGWGSRVFNPLAVAGYEAGMENEITSLVENTYTKYPTSTEGYATIISKGITGLIGNMPAEMKPQAQLYFNQINKTAFSKVATAENKINTDIALGEVNTAIVNTDANITNLAFEGRLEDLQAALIKRDEYASKYIGRVLDPSTYADGKIKLKNEIVNQLALGEFDRALRKGDGEPSVRIKQAEDSLKALKAQDRIAIPDPADPTKTITLTPDQKSTLVKDISNNISDFKDSKIKAAEELRQADELTQIANYNLAMVTVQDDTISPEQKIVSINEAEAKGRVRKEDAVLLRRYVNSVKALNAVTNSQEMGDILVRVNDLNANLNYTADSRDYLSGINNIRADIMVMRANNLTAAKIAGATVDIANGFSKADKQIQTQLNPDLWGTARRALFDQVELKVEELGIVDEREKTRARRDLYNANVTQVIQNIQSSKRLQAIELVNALTTRNIAAPVIATQSQYDALPSGAEFVENGITYRKP
jgi:hypothetical protein